MKLRRTLLAMPLMAVFALAPATASASVQNLTIDRDVQLISGNRVRVSGTIKCTPGDKFRVGVNQLVTNGGDTESRRGGPDNGNCTGSPQNWRVTVERKSGPAFEAGTRGQVQVSAQTGTPGDSGPNDRESETRRVNID